MTKGCVDAKRGKTSCERTSSTPLGREVSTKPSSLGQCDAMSVRPFGVSRRRVAERNLVPIKINDSVSVILTEINKLVTLR